MENSHERLQQQKLTIVLSSGCIYKVQSTKYKMYVHDPLRGSYKCLQAQKYVFNFDFLISTPYDNQFYREMYLFMRHLCKAPAMRRPYVSI